MKKTIIGLFLFLFMVSCRGRQATPVAVPGITPTAVAIPSASTVPPASPSGFPVMPVPVGMVYSKLPPNYDTPVQWWVMTENGPHLVMYRDNWDPPAVPVVSHDHSLAVFSDGQNVWLINLPTDEKRKLTNLSKNEYGYDPVWSPDDQYIIYGITTTNNTKFDLWRLNVQSGENLDLTGGQDRLQQALDLAWQPNGILFSSWKKSDERGNCLRLPRLSISRLTQVRLDGSNYKILDPNTVTFNRPSVSPDGNSIAYDFGHIYSGGQITTVNPKDFGLNFSDTVALMSPSWSPAGTELSWVIADSNNPMNSFNVAVFDLVNKSAKVITQFEPYRDELGACQTSLPDAEYTFWSPDGKWLAVSSLGFDESKYNLDGEWRPTWIRIFNKNGEVLTTIDEAYQPFWSPDGKWLAFDRFDKQGLLTIQVIDTGTWKVWQLDVPANSTITDW